MPDDLKLLTKDYFHRHPLKHISAARIAYSLLLHPEVADAAHGEAGELWDEGLNAAENSAETAAVEQENDTARLLRLVRRKLPPNASKILPEKLFAREEEVLPEIQRMVLKAFGDATIENCTRFLVGCRTNCSEWIMQNYDKVRDPYARSMLCLALGFRADPEAIPFLMRQVEVFEGRPSSDSHEQGPLLALAELKTRFRAL